MINVDKICTNNPFTDELIYYTKYIALNSVVKDEDDALNNETAKSLKNGDLYLACIENRARYEMFNTIPQEIIEKYIEAKSNLDTMIADPKMVKYYISSLGLNKGNIFLDNISKLARIIYIDHYDIMMNYIYTVGDSWVDDNKDLYNKCKNETATYTDLFDIIPQVTRSKIIKSYIVNYSNIDINTICDSIDNFQAYIDSRSDDVSQSIDKINRAMSSCFISHYEMMIDRGYFKKDNKNVWYEYTQFTDIYKLAKDGNATYDDLYLLFPHSDLRDILISVFGTDNVDTYTLDMGKEYLKGYLNSLQNKESLERNLNSKLMESYISIYNALLDKDIYNKCIFTNDLNYFDLIEYIPKETQKIILNTQIKEVTNIEMYAQNKTLFESYLNKLDPSKAADIRKSITIDMMSYFINNYKELNNYYRTYMGLPPLDNKENQYKDTLLYTYDADSDSYISFGNKLLDLIPSNLYSEIHWTNMELCDFDNYDVSILNEYGVFDEFIKLSGKEINSSRYKYIKFLGDNKIDIYTCRKALNFQLLSIPTIDNTEIKNLFIDKFNINRDYVIRTVYSDAYKFESDYYNKFMIIFIMINTIMDVLSAVPELIINKEIFDARSIKYLFESYGIPYYSEIPTKYLKAMLKNLNTLIKYKSSTKNMIDICSLFGFDDIKVFGYYLLKSRNIDATTGNYIFNHTNKLNYNNPLIVVDNDNTLSEEEKIEINNKTYTANRDIIDKNSYNVLIESDDGETNKKFINQDIEVYKISNIDDHNTATVIPTEKEISTNTSSLKFVKVPIDGNLADYKNDDNYIIPYDELITLDDTWDGGLPHNYIKNKILDYEFNSVITKYISVETVTQITEMAFQISYFYNMLFDNYYSEEQLTVKIPYIKMGHNFRFLDTVCYLFALMYLYNGLEDNIMYSPTQILYVKGYNFNDDLNTILKDPNIFTQTANLMEQTNIFNINDQIKTNNYDYQKEFEEDRLNILSFNLSADLDELDKWLNDNYQLSLDDFVVDDTLTKFDRVITLRDFYSINNSYYKKDVNINSVIPMEYNQSIKYGYESNIFKKEYLYDINNQPHEYIKEYYIDESYHTTGQASDIINNHSDDSIYIMDLNRYCMNHNNEDYTIYRKYNRSQDANEYNLNDILMYYKDSDNNYSEILKDGIFIKDRNNDYVLSADNYYKKDSITQNYNKIEDDKYFIIDSNNKKVLNSINYYIKDSNGNYILDPDNCYLLVTHDGEQTYVLAKDSDEYSSHTELSINDCYIYHSDGHFIPLAETDFYVQNDDGSYSYNEEECYIKWNEKTEYFDPEVPNVYYIKVTDYYNITDNIINTDQYYVKDENGNYVKEQNLISPANCYIFDNSLSSYVLISDRYISYYNYKNMPDIDYILIKQPNNDYYRYEFINNEYKRNQDENKRYVINSQNEYITVIISNSKYEDNNAVIVILNQNVNKETEVVQTDYYDPEDDGAWDENDWFYNDPSFDSSLIGMNGENKWYYKKQNQNDNNDDDINDDILSTVGTGFYISPESYLGDYKLKSGEKYYFSMDIETNFDNDIQIACEADTSLLSADSKIYKVTAGDKIHIYQIFTANDIERPRIRFYIYDYKNNPVNEGDYIIISNLKFSQSTNNNYIPQDIPSYDKLQELYRTNEAIYKYLIDLMANCSDYRTYNIYKKLYDSLMISKYNKEAFKLSDGTYAKTYTDFLQSRDTILCERLVYFKSLDMETMQKEIANDIIEVTYAIDDCVDTYSYGYLYSYFPAVSASYIQQYISKIINFFKSWKVHLLGINTLYKFDDKLNNIVKVLEDQMVNGKLNQKDNVHINDVIKINPIDDVDPSGKPYNDLTEYTNSYDENVCVKDRIRIIVNNDNDLNVSQNIDDINNNSTIDINGGKY